MADVNWPQIRRVAARRSRHKWRPLNLLASLWCFGGLALLVVIGALRQNIGP